MQLADSDTGRYRDDYEGRQPAKRVSVSFSHANACWSGLGGACQMLSGQEFSQLVLISILQCSYDNHLLSALLQRHMDPAPFQRVIKELFFARYGTYYCELEDVWLTNLAMKVIGVQPSTDALDAVQISSTCTAVRAPLLACMMLSSSRDNHLRLACLHVLCEAAIVGSIACWLARVLMVAARQLSRSDIAPFK